MTAQSFKPSPLSECGLWNLQEKTYKNLGPRAWTEAGVPFYITCSPHTAKCYAQIVLGFLHDLKKLGHQSLNILEIGAGTGKFAFHFLSKLMALAQKDPTLPSIYYIMSDVAEKNIQFWQTQKEFYPYLSNQKLVFASFNALNHQCPQAVIGRAISLKDSPLCVIANYLFDTMPQEFLQVGQNRCVKGIVNFTSELTLEVLPKLSWETLYDTSKPSTPTVPLLQELVKQTQIIELLSPTGPMQVIENLSKQTSKPILLLAGDKGPSHIHQFISADCPKIALHGTFSFPVNFPLLASFIESRKGKALLPSLPRSHFTVMAALLQRDPFPFTNEAYDLMDAYGPEDHWLCLPIEESDFYSILSFLKKGDFDILDLNGVIPALKKLLPTLNGDQKTALKAVVQQCYASYYPLSSKEAYLICKLALLFLEIEDTEGAKIWIEIARQIDPQNPLLPILQAFCLNESIKSDLGRRLSEQMHQLLNQF